MKDQKDLIIDGFRKMDISLLEILLDDNLTYQNVSKALFLKKINAIFNTLKTKGDTFLISFRGVCVGCESKGCGGYTFVGNHSRTSLDLVFEEDIEKFTDIYSCNDFSTKDKMIDTNEKLSIYFSLKEKDGYVETAEDIIRNQTYTNALKCELINQKEPLYKYQYKEWLEKYEELYDYDFYHEIQSDEVDAFFELYSDFSKLGTFSGYYKMARKGINDYINFDINNEPFLLKWLVEYEQVGLESLVFNDNFLDYKLSESEEYFKVLNFKIMKIDFEKMVEFSSLFGPNYYKMLEKYDTSTLEEKHLSLKTGAEIHNLFSLAYHLNKKGL